MKWILLLSAFCVSLPAQAKLKIGTSTQDMEALVQAVGGDQVETFAVAKGTQDPHQIEAKPSFMVKFRGADLIIAQGLELESAWLKPLVEGSRNPRLAYGGKGVLELGGELDPLDVAKGSVSRAEGDVHPAGNPHFQVDPIRLGRAAVLIGARLGEIDPTHKDQFQKAAAGFQKHMEEKTQSWKLRLQKTGLKEFVSYHKTLTYFADRFGLTNNLFLEPKPGIPPTASHMIEVINQIKARKIKAVLIENFFDDSVKGKLEKDIPSIRVVKVPVAVGGDETIRTNEDLIERLVSTLETIAR